jgi:PAS domain S-box-containing protein
VRFAPDFHQGQVRGLIVFALDITQGREAERELAEQERRFKLLVEGVRDYAMYMLDPQGRVTTWNAGAERNKGYTAAQVLGQPFGLFFVAEDIASGEPSKELALAARDGRFVTEAWRIRGDGSRFWAGVSLTAIRDERQRLIGYAKITRDLTEQRRQQSEIERALADKETLLKEVYHRVKNNLQVVQSLLTLQRQALSDGPARAALQDSVLRVRAMALVHEKLYQSGNLAAVSLETYTRDLMRQISETHGEAGLRIKLHADIANIETGLDSAVPFGLLLTELVTNCFKHAFPDLRSGEIRVRLVRREDGDLLTVSDDGVGFAEGFEPGVQSASMGFQVAHGLALQLGGELQARSDGGTVLSALLTRL